MSVETPENISVPVVVIAPDEIVPMLDKYPKESISISSVCLNNWKWHSRQQLIVSGRM